MEELESRKQLSADYHTLLEGMITECESRCWYSAVERLQ